MYRQWKMHRQQKMYRQWKRCGVEDSERNKWYFGDKTTMKELITNLLVKL